LTANQQSDTGRLEEQGQAAKSQGRDQHNEESREGQGKPGEGQFAVQPGRRRDRHPGRPEQVPRGLLRDQTHAPGGQKRIERAIGQPLNQADLQSRPKHPGAHEGRQNRRRQAQRTGHEAHGQIGDVAAEHHDLAVRHVDDAHQAKAEGQPKSSQ